MEYSRSKKKRGSITRRFILTDIVLVLLVLIAVELGSITAIQSYYYNAARQYMVSKVNAVVSVLNRTVEDGSVTASMELRTLLENFSEREKMELMVVDWDGNIVLTSSGFAPENNSDMTDYEMAMSESEKIAYGYCVSRMYSGEKIMAVSYPISNLSTQYSAVRVVSSLSQIDETILSFFVLITLICLGVLVLIAFSGVLFINTIVTPIQRISSTTGKLANGDFSERIEHEANDEIGELCESINHMASELQNTENMKNEFISSVSHELRTPLTAIQGWAETLSSGTEELDETTRKGLRVILGETERLTQMVEELLDFSRIQSGHFTLLIEPMDILAELGEAVLIYTERARKENIQIDYTEPEMLPVVYGDKSRLRQVFINIIDNAVKYSNPGGRVTIYTEDLKTKIKIIISDNGCGIKKSDLGRIKTKFFKANQTRRGSGIGLAVADEIVIQHKGSLEVSSEEGKGTTVTITLPAGVSHKE